MPTLRRNILVPSSGMRDGVPYHFHVSYVRIVIEFNFHVTGRSEPDIDLAEGN
jgi:hypothetical protein